jgi:putative glutamine amidotransferase
VPILIPTFDDLSGLNALLPHLNGLLLSGGIDVNPYYYQEEPHERLGSTNPKVDELEIALARWALEQDVPTLGICRGMQLLNVALGGNLYQDINAQYPADSLRHANWDLPRDHIAHVVKVEPRSYMEKVLGMSEVPVNSLHHQAVKDPGDGVSLSGYASDGIAEMLEVPTHSFMMAVQCHPEELYAEYPVWSRLFEAFINSCSTSLPRSKQPIAAAI